MVVTGYSCEHMSMVVVGLTIMEDMVTEALWREWWNQVPTYTQRVTIKCKASIVVRVISMHGTGLGEASKNLRLVLKLQENLARFDMWWVIGNSTKCSCERL